MILTFVFVLFVSSPVYVNAATYSKTGQDITAYVADSGKLTYSGTTPSQYITASVHPVTFGDPTSGLIYPFGAIISMPNDCLTTPGGCKTTFLVSDMGDVDNTRGVSLYWFDLYYGVGTKAGDVNYDNAVAFGKKTNKSYTVSW